MAMNVDSDADIGDRLGMLVNNDAGIVHVELSSAAELIPVELLC